MARAGDEVAGAGAAAGGEAGLRNAGSVGGGEPAVRGGFFEEGRSASAGVQGAVARPRADVDWGTGIKALIGVSTVLSILCAVIGIELIRTMWFWTQPGSESTPSAVLQMVGGLF